MGDVDPPDYAEEEGVEGGDEVVENVEVGEPEEVGGLFLLCFERGSLNQLKLARRGQGKRWFTSETALSPQTKPTNVTVE